MTSEAFVEIKLPPPKIAIPKIKTTTDLVTMEPTHTLTDPPLISDAECTASEMLDRQTPPTAPQYAHTQEARP